MQTFTTNFTSLMSRTYHINKGCDTSSTSGAMQVVWGNWYAASTGEVAGAATMNIWASIEYPQGVFTLCTFNGGQANGVVAPGATIVSDPTSVSIPGNQAFWVHMLVQSTGGDIFIPVSSTKVSQANNAPYGNYTIIPAIENNLWQWTAAQWAQNGVDPRVLVTTATAPVTGANTNNSNFSIYPLAVLSYSSVPSILCIGDSRIRGQNDAVYSIGSQIPTAAQPADSATWGAGQCCRAIGFYYPYCNGGVDADTVQQFNLTHAFRLGLQQFYTHMTSNYGINDVTAGRNLATIQTALGTFWALWSIPTSHQTILPKTTSTDSWATVANQTVDAANAVRTGLNDWLRSKPLPLSAVFDTTRVLESGPDNGKWNAMDGVPPSQVVTTLDGLHPSPFGYYLIQYSDTFYPGAFAAEQ